MIAWYVEHDSGSSMGNRPNPAAPHISYKCRGRVGFPGNSGEKKHCLADKTPLFYRAGAKQAPAGLAHRGLFPRTPGRRKTGPNPSDISRGKRPSGQETPATRRTPFPGNTALRDRPRAQTSRLSDVQPYLKPISTWSGTGFRYII